jgi:phosphate transport system substrate-binding protein
MRCLWMILFTFALARATTSSAAEPMEVLPIHKSTVAADAYIPQALVKGTLKLAGSRTMGQLAGIWSDGFRHMHPDVKVDFDGKGSEAGLERLAADRATVGLVSRQLTAADQKAFKQIHPDLKLQEIDVAFDAIAVIVHPDNPVANLSVKQLQTLFGSGDSAGNLKWGSIGLSGDWAELPVVRVIPDESSGTRNQFRSSVLGDQGDFAKATTDSWHTRIVEKVAADRGAIGFVSFANAHSNRIRAVPLVAANGDMVELSAETIGSEDYPLIRPLTVVVVMDKEGVKDPLAAELLRYVLGRNGQDDVIKEGFQPLGRSALLEQFDRLGWNQSK